MTEQVRRLLSQFVPEDRVLVLISADPDALGSALAFKRLLWRRVASVTVARANEVRRPDNLAMIRLLKLPVLHVSQVKASDFTKVAMLDSQPHHSEAFQNFSPQVVIDHHPVGDALGEVPFVDVRPQYGANSSIMTEYLQAAKIKPSTRVATGLVYGIKNDTAGFQRPCLEEDVKAFQFVFPKANHSLLRKIEFSEMRLKDLEWLRLALDRMTVIRKRSVFAYLGHVPSPDNLVQIADFFLKIDSIDFSAVVGRCQEKLVVIMRQSGSRANAGKVAQEAFGDVGSAGGHKAMARAEVPLIGIEDKDKVDDAALARFARNRVFPRRVRRKKEASPPAEK